MIDTHTHIQFKIFDKNRGQVILDAKNAGVEKIIAVGTNLETSKKAIAVAKIYPEVFASVGIHPHHVFGIMNHELGIMDQLEKILSHPKVIALGETGLDRHLYKKTKYKKYKITDDFISFQKSLFSKHIKLAIKHNKALIIHNRQAVEETLEILEKNWDKELERKAVFHMCEPDPRLLNFAKEHNIFISFGGDIIYDLEKQEFLKKVPLELLVLETDSPFLMPKDCSYPNTPVNLELIAQTVAETKKINLQEVTGITFENGKRLFGIN